MKDLLLWLSSELGSGGCIEKGVPKVECVPLPQEDLDLRFLFYYNALHDAVHQKV